MQVDTTVPVSRGTQLKVVTLISLLQNGDDTLWFIHKVILYRGKNLIDYQYWLGLSPENSGIVIRVKPWSILIRVKLWLEKRLASIIC